MQRGMHRIENAFQVFGHVAVPEAKNPKTLPLEPGLPLAISLGNVVSRMGRTVELDHQPRGKACEIDHVRADRDLPSPMSAEKRNAAHLRPEFPLGPGRGLPQLPRTRAAEATEGVGTRFLRPCTSRRGWISPPPHHPRPIRRALSASYHQVWGAPSS